MNDNANQHQTCLVCNSPNIHALPGYEHCHLVKCSACSFVFARQIPSLEELNDCYSQYSYDREQYLSPITIKRYNELLDEFEPYRQTGRLLDVGCGMGFFAAVAKQRGWDVYGTEYSEKAIEICEAKGIKMKQGVLNSADFDGMEFDVVTSFEVIEHINNPQQEMGHIVKLMRKGGLFYCTTPNFNSLMRYYLKGQYDAIVYPEHLSYYTCNSIHKLFTSVGLNRKKMLTTGISFTRIKTSKGQSDQFHVGKDSDDEKMRVMIEGKWYMQLAKSMANGLLSALRLGLTIKGYYVKP